MTNHVRTLLLNMPPEAVGTTPGEEYVPRDYRPAQLPADLQRAAQALFGAGADRAGKNIQLARIAGYLHASPLAEYVTATDARLTYRPGAPASVFDLLGATVTNVTDDPAEGWLGAATFAAPGRAYGVWQVTTDGAGNYTVTGQGATTSGGVTTTSTGDAIPLPGSRLSLVVTTGAAGAWAASLLAAPAHNFVEVVTTGDPDAVFRPGQSGSEDAWYAAWNESPVAALRAGAFALGLAARIQEVLDGSDVAR